MIIQLKPLSKEGIDRALAKAERYRLLSEPTEAESICLDILETEPDNQAALVTLLLARTDQFDAEREAGVARAREVLPRLRDEYDRAYYRGIICERQAKARLRQNLPGTGPRAYEELRAAMRWYEQAESIRQTGQDDAILRWNTCARLIMQYSHLAPSTEQAEEPLMLE